MGVEDGDFSEYIGMTTGQGTLVVERAPVTAFARAVQDPSPIYRNADVARAQGFDNIPVPPSFGFQVRLVRSGPSLGSRAVL